MAATNEIAVLFGSLVWSLCRLFAFGTSKTGICQAKKNCLQNKPQSEIFGAAEGFGNVGRYRDLLYLLVLPI